MKTLKFLPLLAAATLLAPGGLLAQTTRTWDRGASTDVLNTAANWSGDAVPASTSAVVGGRQDASFNGSVTGPLSLTYGAAFGGSFGVGLVMTANQTNSLNIANSAATKQTFRLVNSTSSTVGGIQLAAGAGALTIGAAGTNNPITLALGQGSTALNYYFANNSANTATIEENVIIEMGGGHNASLIFSAGNWNVKGVVHNLSGTANEGSLAVNAGTVTLSGNNTGHFDVFVNGGILNFSAANNLGVGTDNIRIGQTTTTGKLVYNGASAATISRQIDLGNGSGAGDTGGSIIDNDGVGVLTFDNAAFNKVGNTGTNVNRVLTLGGTNTGANTISGVIANNDDGNVSINKAGTGKWVLSGDNTLTGGVTVSEGTLVVGHDNALGTGTINLRADATNEVARLQSDGTDRTFTNAVTFGGAEAATANYLGGAGTGKLTFNGAINWGSAAKTYTIDGSTVEFGGAWTGNSGTEANGIAGTDTATSIVILNGDRGTAVKQIDIGNSVTVRANHANSFGSDNTEPLNILGTTNTGVVELINNITLARTLSVQGRDLANANVAVRNLSGTNTIDLSVGASGERYNIESTAGNLTISNVTGSTGNRNLFVTGAGNVTLADWAGRNDLTMNGSGTLTMGGTASSLSGTATVNSGTLFLNAVGGVGALSATGGLVIDNNATVVTTGGGNSIGTNTAVTVNTGGLLDMRKNNIIGALAGGGTVRNTTTTDYTLTVNNDGGTSSFGGVIEQGSTGKINLAKNGNGTLTLTGTNTYTGSTTVQAGLLVVNGDSSSAIGRLDVAAGATLGGSGTLGGATTINSGAFHSPGNSPGVQTFTSGLTYSNGSTFVWELTGNTDSGRGTVFDGVNVSGGTLTINGGVTNNLVFNGAGSTVSWSDAFWDSNQQWLVFDNASLPTVSSNVFVTINVGLDSISQSLTSVRSGSSFSWDTIGSDVYLTYAIPEPSTYALLALAAAALGVCVRRRRDNRPSLPALASSRPALHEESSRIMES